MGRDQACRSDGGPGDAAERGIGLTIPTSKRCGSSLTSQAHRQRETSINARSEAKTVLWNSRLKRRRRPGRSETVPTGGRGSHRSRKARTNAGRGPLPSTLGTAMHRMQDDVLLHVTGLTREEAAVGLFKGTIRLFGGEIRRSDLWISPQPGLWPFDMAVGTASDPTTWLTVGTAGVAKVGGLFSEAAEAVKASQARGGSVRALPPASERRIRNRPECRRKHSARLPDWQCPLRQPQWSRFTVIRWRRRGRLTFTGWTPRVISSSGASRRTWPSGTPSLHGRQAHAALGKRIAHDMIRVARRGWSRRSPAR